MPRAGHAASATLVRQRRKRHSALTLRHKTPLLGGLGDYCTRDFRRVRAPIRQRDCTDRPPRRPPWQLSIAPAAAPPGTQQRRVSRRADSGTCRVVGPRGGGWRTIADCRARSRLRSSLVQLERNRMLKHLTRTHTGAMKAHHASVSANEGTSTARRSRASRHASNLRRRRRRVRAARRYADRRRECRSRTERRT